MLIRNPLGSQYPEERHHFFGFWSDFIRYIFGEFMKPYIKEIDHPKLITEWKLNLYIEASKNKSKAK